MVTRESIWFDFLFWLTFSFWATVRLLIFPTAVNKKKKKKGAKNRKNVKNTYDETYVQ